MYKTKLCLGLSSSFSLPYEQQIRTLRQIGFEGFFTGWSREADIALLLAAVGELAGWQR